MDLFEHYEEDFIESLQSIKKRIENVPKLDSCKYEEQSVEICAATHNRSLVVERTREVQSAETELSDAEGLLRSMSLSAKNVPSNSSLLAVCHYSCNNLTTTFFVTFNAQNTKYTHIAHKLHCRASALQKVKNYEADIKALRGNLRKAELQFQQNAERDQLFSGGAGYRDDIMASSMDQRQRLLDNTDRLDRCASCVRACLCICCVLRTCGGLNVCTCAAVVRVVGVVCERARVVGCPCLHESVVVPIIMSCAYLLSNHVCTDPIASLRMLWQLQRNLCKLVLVQWIS